MAGVFTMIVLGIAWNDFVSWLDLFYLTSTEIKLIFMLTLYFIILAVLEGFVVDPIAFLVSIETIPYLIVLFARKIFR
ncbi:hypothetical protein GWK48_06775 [Metallosphaera tengchongensis]|uniref:Uncharacterized protein n=2 Tax=Metallosphaera tengchongensis TaxID=1532350 RepID=A0A6N0P0B7_9CREN|nr:hypothetical protein GWK48_06775 [Metallosphaera tengchongensis]